MVERVAVLIRFAQSHSPGISFHAYVEPVEGAERKMRTAKCPVVGNAATR